MVDMGGMRLVSFGGGYGGTSAPMGSMTDIRACLWSHGSINTSFESWCQWGRSKKMEMAITLKLWMSDDVLAFLRCKLVLNFIV
jgi:hypothetical protein